jgi:hypothetical protein
MPIPTLSARTLLSLRRTPVVRPPAKPAFVMVVADSQQTLDDLHSYFTRVGVTSNGARQLGDVSIVPGDVTSLVLFPDAFDRALVEGFILAVRRSRLELPILLVSSAPQQLAAAVAPDGVSVPPLVLPRPAFGWTILDAIRARTPEPESD